MILDALRDSKARIDHLNLYGNPIDDECMEHLGAFVDNHKSLRLLILSNTLITDRGIKILSNYLIGNTHLLLVISIIMDKLWNHREL